MKQSKGKKIIATKHEDFDFDCSTNKSEMEKVGTLEHKLEELKKGHGRKMSADKFLKELSKW